jgi:hypothetical protein
VNFLQLVQRLRTETKASGSSITSVVNQTGEYGRLVDWINDAWLDIQSERTDWEWMRATATFPTVTGRPVNTLAQIGLTSFGTWARNTFRNYVNPQVTLTLGSPGVVNLPTHNLTAGDTFVPFTTGALFTGLTAGTTYYVLTTPTAGTFTVAATAGGTAIDFTGTQSGTHTMTSNNTTIFIGLNSEIYMDYADYSIWRDRYEYGSLRQTQTRPIEVTITPDKSIGLGPFPIAGYTVLGDYYTVPAYMAANGDTPAMPAQFHMAIVYKALISYGTYEEDGFIIARAERELKRFMRKLSADRLTEVKTCGALA